MAVQRSKKSRSRGGMRRSHDGLRLPALSVDAMSGEKHIRHHMTANGFYRGKQIMVAPVVDDEEVVEDVANTTT